MQHTENAEPLLFPRHRCVARLTVRWQADTLSIAQKGRLKLPYPPTRKFFFFALDEWRLYELRFLLDAAAKLQV
jgi:hypothetical protein